jgi:multidrug efflux pump subunit AcrB
VETFYDQSDLVRASIGSVRDSLVVGALLAVIVIMVVLRSRRLGLAGAVVLPASIALTLVGLSALGQSLNMMTLGGIAAAVGLVLDDGIVVVEHLAARATGAHPATRAHAMSEILPTLVGSSLCSLAIFLPFALLGGVTGAFFRVLSLSMALMLGSSLLFCLTLVPLVSPVALVAPERPRRVARRFTRWLEIATVKPWIGLAAVAGCLAAAVPLYLSLGSGFLPEMDEGSLIMDYVSPPGTSLEETDRILREVEKEIAGMPEIVSWSRRTGDQLGFFITEPNIGDYALRLRPGHRRSADEIADELRRKIEKTQPSLDVEFGQLVEDVIGDLTSTPQPIEVRIFDEDRAIGQEKARQVAAVLEQVPGVVDVRDGIVVSGPNVTIAPAAGSARSSRPASELAGDVAPAIGGTDVGSIARGARSWPLRIVLPRPPGLSGAEILSHVAIPAGSGGVRVSEVASIRTNPGETEIARDNLRTMVAPTARLSGRDLGSAMRETQRRIRERVVMPAEATIQYGGLWAEQQSSFRGLAWVALAAVALVMAILLFSFQSWLEAAAVLLVVVSSLVGVFAALLVGRATFNISSFVGAIMMVGIVSENAYFLVAAYRLSLQGGATVVEAAREAARRRTRPVLMTTFAGVAALAPLALGVGAGSALLKPLAIAVVGGFVTSAFLLLIVLPSLLAGFEVRRDPTQRNAT